MFNPLYCPALLPAESVPSSGCPLQFVNDIRKHAWQQGMLELVSIRLFLLVLVTQHTSQALNICKPVCACTGIILGMWRAGGSMRGTPIACLASSWNFCHLEFLETRSQYPQSHLGKSQNMTAFISTGVLLVCGILPTTSALEVWHQDLGTWLKLCI